MPQPPLLSTVAHTYSFQVARFSRLVGGGGLDVLVLSEHMLLALSETGDIRTQIRLDFIPTALTVYQVRPSTDAAKSQLLSGPGHRAQR